MAAVRLMKPSVLRSFQNCTRKLEDPYRLAVASSKLLECAMPVLSCILHTSAVDNASRRSGPGRNRGHGGSGKKGGLDDQIRCPSCNSPFTEVDRFKGHPRFIRCLECQYFYLQVHETQKHVHSSKEETLRRPKELKTYLDKYVVGQEHAKIVLSTAVYNHYKRIRHNIPEQKTAAMATETAPTEVNLSTAFYHPKGTVYMIYGI